MSATAEGALPLRSDEDVVRARHRVRELAVEAGLRLIDQTKIVTAVSELARNTVVHGGGGAMTAGIATDGTRTGVWAEFSDEGPGIADLQQALSEGFTTGQGLGLGFGGAKRLVHEFDVRTAPGEGTTVRVTTWR
ncbi:anti-sigma regulatory factor [Conexibacter woesei]|uniref:anti-sigma regulatory factor n=1 Tax=Conexibacter woesei TaxID=191495 RepID=UPI00047DF6FC